MLRKKYVYRADSLPDTRYHYLRGDSMLRKKYVYRADGLPDTEYHYRMDKKYPLVTEHYAYTYDDSGRTQTKTLTTVPGPGSEQWTYAYHRQGSESITTVYRMRGGKRKGVARQMTYDAAGRLIGEEDFGGMAEAHDYIYAAGSNEWLIMRHYVRDRDRLKRWTFVAEYRRR